MLYLFLRMYRYDVLWRKCMNFVENYIICCASTTLHFVYYICMLAFCRLCLCIKLERRIVSSKSPSSLNCCCNCAHLSNFLCFQFCLNSVNIRIIDWLLGNRKFNLLIHAWLHIYVCESQDNAFLWSLCFLISLIFPKAGFC